MLHLDCAATNIIITAAVRVIVPAIIRFAASAVNVKGHGIIHHQLHHFSQHHPMKANLAMIAALQLLAMPIDIAVEKLDGILEQKEVAGQVEK